MHWLNWLNKQDVWGLQLYFSSKRFKQEALSVVSNQLKGKEALAAYKLRWGIEVLFGHLKKNGFNLEGTHLREPSKIDKLIAIVSLSFLFTLGFGMLLKARDKASSLDTD